jgi:hypothetical protein
MNSHRPCEQTAAAFAVLLAFAACSDGASDAIGPGSTPASSLAMASGGGQAQPTGKALGPSARPSGGNSSPVAASPAQPMGTAGGSAPALTPASANAANAPGTAATPPAAGMAQGAAGQGATDPGAAAGQGAADQGAGGQGAAMNGDPGFPDKDYFNPVLPCEKGKTTPSEVIIMGDSFYALSGQIQVELENDARMAGVLAQGQRYRSYAISGGALQGNIPGEFDTALRAGKVKVVMMDAASRI